MHKNNEYSWRIIYHAIVFTSMKTHWNSSITHHRHQAPWTACFSPQFKKNLYFMDFYNFLCHMFMHIQCFLYLTHCWIGKDLFQDKMGLLIKHFLHFGLIKMQLITEHLPWHPLGLCSLYGAGPSTMLLCNPNKPQIASAVTECNFEMLLFADI